MIAYFVVEMLNSVVQLLKKLFHEFCLGKSWENDEHF